MSQGFKSYRRQAFTAIRQLLCCEEKHVVDWYIRKAKETRTEAELSRVLVEVRNRL